MKQHTLQVKETNGEMYFELPDDLLDRLGWKEGDELSFEDKGDGSFIITKVRMSSIELDFTDEELFKFMKHAHSEDLSFNQWVNRVVKTYVVEDRLDGLYDKEVT